MWPNLISDPLCAVMEEYNVITKGSSSCRTCPKGTFQEDFNRDVCSVCPNGTVITETDWDPSVTGMAPVTDESACKGRL